MGLIPRLNSRFFAWHCQPVVLLLCCRDLTSPTLKSAVCSAFTQSTAFHNSKCYFCYFSPGLIYRNLLFFCSHEKVTKVTVVQKSYQWQCVNPFLCHSIALDNSRFSHTIYCTCLADQVLCSEFCEEITLVLTAIATGSAPLFIDFIL